MLSTTSTILDQISTEKTKVSERLARLDTERATVVTRLTDLETAERVLTRVSKTPPSRRPTSTAAAETKAPAAGRGRGRPPKAAATKSAAHKPSAPSLAGCGKSRDFGKTVMKRARNGSPGLIKSTGYEGAKGDESGWKHHRPTFSAAC